ncbi:phosphotransferase [Candidatus Vidania fulgoroideorum]
MAVFIKNKKGIKKKITKIYNINIKKITNINKGTDNSNFYINTKNKKFILTIFENIKYEYLIRCLRFMVVLNKNGVKTPKQIKNKKHKIFYIKKKPFSIFSIIMGKNIEKIKNIHLYTIGILLARIHNITIKNVRFYIRNRNDFNIIKKKYILIKKLINEEYNFLIRNEIDFQNNNKLRIKKIVCHNDLFRDNVFFNKKEKYISGIIDFYFSGYDYITSDISIIINDWCIKNNNIDKYKVIKLIKSYLKIKEISKKYITSLNMNLRYIALRFLITRIYDIKIKKKVKEYKNKKISTFKKILYKYVKNEFFFKEKYKK